MQPRRLMSRIALSLAAVSTAAALVAGCSSSSTPTEDLPDAAGLLEESSAATKSLSSGHLDITVDGTIEGLPVKKLTGDLTNVPATAVDGSATISMGGSDVDIDLVVIDGTLFAAMTPNSWLDMGPAAEIYDPSVILNPDNGLANMLGNFTDPKSEDVETVNGVETVKVTGTVNADAVNKLIPQLNASGSVPGTAWIEKDGDHNLVQAEINPSDDTSVVVVLSDWNKPVTVERPAV